MSFSKLFINGSYKTMYKELDSRKAITPLQQLNNAIHSAETLSVRWKASKCLQVLCVVHGVVHGIHLM